MHTCKQFLYNLTFPIFRGILVSIQNILNQASLRFGERLALLPLFLVFALIFSFEQVGQVKAEEKVFRQNFNPDGLFVLVGSLENIDFGEATVKTEPVELKKVEEVQKLVSVKVEAVRVPATPTPKVQAQLASQVIVSGDIWDQLAMCESKGNWAINTGNGYYGGLQFSQGAWNSVGGSGLPSDASREEQIERGKMLQARRGWGAWGLCAKKLNLN